MEAFEYFVVYAKNRKNITKIYIYVYVEQTHFSMQKEQMKI